MLKQLKPKQWEIEQSSLFKMGNHKATYDECRLFSCEDIAKNLTHISENSPFILEIPRGEKFHFIGRVDTNLFENNPVSYYNQFETRNYISFSIINNMNISHYPGSAFFVYDILPEDIVHVFPADSNIRCHAKYTQDLTTIPSLWITLKELEDITEKLKVYNQLTCRTKRNGQVLKPIAVIAFGEVNDDIQKIAKRFGINCIVIHPNEDAINYEKDLIKDICKFNEVSSKIREYYELDIRSIQLGYDTI